MKKNCFARMRASLKAAAIPDAPASVIAASEDSSNPDSQPSETVVSERQDVKPESATVPDIRRRRSMTLPDYKKHFLSRWITTSAPRSMSAPLRNGKSLRS